MNAADLEIPFAGRTVKVSENHIKVFWSRVNKDGPLPDQDSNHYIGLNQCWVWTGGKNRQGYGRLNIAGVQIPTHRLSFLIANGSLPEKAQVLHHCDFMCCCNPKHLFAGTHDDNMLDRVGKGRIAHPAKNEPLKVCFKRSRGEDHHKARATDELVKALRSEYLPGVVTFSDLANKYGMSKAQVHKIIRGKFWKHVPDPTGL